MNSPLWDYDKELFQGYDFLCGSDEVGRGSFCGPIVGAAVILKDSAKELPIKNSKKLSQKKREELADIIPEVCYSYAIVEKSPIDIDTDGIQYCNKYVLRNSVIRAIEEFQNTLVLIDGRELWSEKDFDCIFQPKADDLSMAVAAASIIAKVYRDNLLIEMGEKYPEYNFAKNKGYGTKEHRDAINEFGIIKGFHREAYIKEKVDERTKDMSC